MKEDFYITLLSNSSMTYYPENTTSHFITKWPQHVTLEGEWLISLTEIQIPLTFQHISEKLGNNVLTFIREEKNVVLSKDKSPHLKIWKDINFNISSSLYEHLNDLLKEMNNFSKNSYLKFSRKSGGYVNIEQTCTCRDKNHYFQSSNSLKKILGFQHHRTERILVEKDKLGTCPANLNSDLPSNLLIYSDLCAPYITGVVYSRLLRNVTINFQKYNYGSKVVKNFSPPNYFPLLNSSFQTIETDIRDQFGKSIPFDYGTVTVTLHFKRLR